ncbi:MAG: Gldg family protein [Lachnospiraceae bacterium]|nr:Gldg family protein [Lachnospiraceae bacterium]
MTAILFKELKSYFKSLFGWIFLAVFTLFEGAYFVANNIQYGSPYISDSISPLVIVLIFILPLLTMRILAEEKRQKTDQFLITAPIPLSSVIIGKFLALCVIMLMATAICSVGVGILAIYGSIPVVETICALVGFFLFGCQCIAIGMFLSSITEHQFLAAIFTYTVYIFTLIVPGFCGYIFGADKVITKIFNITDIYAPFYSLMSGVIVLTDILYMISVTAIFLILSYKVFAKNSVQLSAMGRNRFFLSNMLPFVIIAAIIGANIGCSFIPSKYTEFDITKNGWYKITDETKAVLDTLNEDVTIYVISSEEEVDNTVKHYINSYDSYSKHVKVVYKPTSKYPEFASNFTDAALYYSSLIVTMGDQFRVIDYYDMFEYTYDFSYTQNITGIDVEGQITAAISSMINGDNRVKIYCLSGHDELSLPTYITDSLTKVGYSFTELYLYGKAVPDDCDILVINGPRSDIDDLDIEAIKTYINKGGKIFMTTSTEDSNCANYDKFIEWLGIDITEGTVLEGDYRYMASADDPSWILTIPEESSPYKISDKKMNILCYARGLKYDYENIPADTTITDIFYSSRSAYAKELLSQEVAESGISKADGDEEGPFPLGVYLTRTNSATGETAKIVIIGSGAFLYEQIDSIVSRGNSDIFIDASKKLIDNTLVTTIPVKELTYDQIVVTMSMTLFYVAVYCVIAPLAFIVTGIVILIIRRRK